MFITPAYAQSGSGSPDFLMSILPFLMIFVIMYFLIIRPQQKRMREHREMVANVRRGDTVVTSGGMIGKVVKVEDQELQLEIATGVKVRVMRTTLAEVRGKGQPVEAAKS